MKRVLIIGSPGAGKSTLAKELARRSGLPLIHLDDLYWDRPWVRAERWRWLEALGRSLRRPEWIMEGNYTSTLDERLAWADTAVLLTPPRALCLSRVIRRELSGQHPHMVSVPRRVPDLAFLKYTWRFSGRLKQTRETLARHPGVKGVELRSDAEAEAWLRGVPGCVPHP